MNKHKETLNQIDLDAQQKRAESKDREKIRLMEKRIERLEDTMSKLLNVLSNL